MGEPSFWATSRWSMTILGVGDAACRSRRRPAIGVPSPPSGAGGGSSPCRIRCRAAFLRRSADFRQFVVAERLEGREFEQDAGQPQFGGQAEHAHRIEPAVASGVRVDAEFHVGESSVSSAVTFSCTAASRSHLVQALSVSMPNAFHFFFGDPAPGDGVLRPVGQAMVVFHDDFHDAAPGLLQDFAQPFADRLRRSIPAPPTRPGWV